MAFTTTEIEQAYAAMGEAVAGYASSGDWTGYCDHFTPDATYIEHAYGTFHGREEIRAWAVKTMGAFPGRVMTGFPIAWQVIDPDAGRLVCEVGNVMPDPGDGTIITEPNITIMTYAGDGLFSCEEDVYNPMRFAAMAVRWARIAREHGNLEADGEKFLADYGGMVAEG